MSVITLSDYITCLNKNESLESIIKRLITVSSSETLYVRTDASIYLATSTYDLAFVNADLQTVSIGGVDHIVLEVTHNFGTNAYDYVVKDGSGNTVIVAQSVIDLNSTYIIIDDTITGTWTIHLWTV